MHCFLNCPCLLFPFLVMPSQEPVSLNSLSFILSSALQYSALFISNYKKHIKRHAPCFLYLFVLFCFVNLSLSDRLELWSLSTFGISLTESRHSKVCTSFQSICSRFLEIMLARASLKLNSSVQQRSVLNLLDSAVLKPHLVFCLQRS